MLKILQARLPQYMSCELPDVQAGLRTGRGTTDQIANICLIIEKAREFQKNIYFCIVGYTKAFDCVDHNKLWKILQEIRLPDPEFQVGIKSWSAGGMPASAAAAAAKLLQSCPTLCDPIDGSPLDSSVPGFSRKEH